MRILLVEDDPELGDGLTIGLRQAGFAVDWVRDGNAADHALHAESFDLVVLDLGLPRLSGMEVLTRARARGQAMPVLILTARDATGDKISANLHLIWTNDNCMNLKFLRAPLTLRWKACSMQPVPVYCALMMKSTQTTTILFLITTRVLKDFLLNMAHLFAEMAMNMFAIPLILQAV